MSLPKVSVVILNWNGKQHLEEFLPTVYNSQYENLEIVVGDNASTDDSVKFVKDNFPLIKIIENHENLGYAGGYNAVLKQVEADYYVLLNSDVEVPPYWINPVIELMESDNQIAIAQPKIKSFFQRDYFEYAGAAGGFIDKFGYPFCRGRIFDSLEKDNGQYNDIQEIFWASGCALFIKSLAWKRLGGLDANFFAHMEEIDICWRAKNLGLKVMYCGLSEVYHVGGGTLNTESPHKTYLNFRNNAFLLKKNLSPIRTSFVIPFRFFLDFLALLRFAFKRQFANAGAVSKAHRAVCMAFLKRKINYNKDISNHPNKTGLYQKSIVWDYFVKKKKEFKDLEF
ncbi:glycosyl transferase family 2 [Pseudopedobacter saltans DSM 12145]|uniref:Glycosyl transferase family 2 n=1 Tax=Pseudopedobacter saltans (strain ATCC 51119 / DSM 12145 / JCM 21818 / CCUG 39354 / LMG 10337 / NBRC 100064 / NCIMB 13643) TaxID=762903 RepID=F0SBG7_PSESL|nr:glycosyltransferase family 2 protein [Pseudopedobacter saltans]ADY51613.1 glycosyl transferase family 2 [Pseudopedobacter saltans DSM 12145]